jgi:asparagine synthase (glutamine-hydrolysing)
MGEEPWLTPEGLHQLADAYGSSEGLSPLGWEAKLRRWVWRSRLIRICKASFEALGLSHDVRVCHPFVSGKFLDALGQHGGFGGLGNRTDLMMSVFGDLLPLRVIGRQTKADFTDPLWTTTSQRFARDWSGGGIDRELVDPEALRRHWVSDSRNILSTTLLQVAWLYDHQETVDPRQ